MLKKDMLFRMDCLTDEIDALKVEIARLKCGHKNKEFQQQFDWVNFSPLKFICKCNDCGAIIKNYGDNESQYMLDKAEFLKEKAEKLNEESRVLMGKLYNSKEKNE